MESISAVSIDRLGRNLLDILHTIQFCDDHNICIHFINQGIRTIEPDGKKNPISVLLIQILGVLSQLERSQIRERILEGVQLAKLKGVYKGRKRGSHEDVLKFLSKEKNQKALNYLKRGLSCTETSKLCGLSLNTITKIKQLGLSNFKSEKSN